MTEAPMFVLGSGSAGRRMLLENAGLSFEVMPARVDEDAVKERFLREHGSEALPELADALAAEKALEVSRRTELPVLGGDQILVLEGELFNKPHDMEEARENLKRLRGRTHHLVSALAVAEKGEIVWTYREAAAMTMRAFSDTFLERYLATVGEKARSSVGCYQVEGPGIQLFENIEGDYFTIVGLPLVPFLHWLRERGLLPE